MLVPGESARAAQLAALRERIDLRYEEIRRLQAEQSRDFIFLMRQALRAELTSELRRGADRARARRVERRRARKQRRRTK